MKKTLSFFLKLAVSAGLLFYLFRHTDFRLLWQSFKQIKPSWFLLAILFFFAFQLLSTYRWYKIAEILGFKKNYLFFVRVYFIGVYFNTFLPGLLGGDIVRVFYLVKEGAAKSVASFSVLYDRGFGLLGALFLLIVFLPLEGAFLPPLAQRGLLFLSMAILAAVLVVVLFSRTLREKIGHELFQTLTAVAPPANFAKLFILGLLVQAFYNVHVYFLGLSLGLSLAWPKYFLIIPLMGILASLPVSLGGFGIREGTLSYFLQLLGYPKELGIALGFLIYGVMLLGGIIGGILYLTGPRGLKGSQNG